MSNFTIIKNSEKQITNKTVLVFLPTYNRVDKVIKSIESLQNQSYKDIIIDIIDDNSTDNTIEVILDYIKTNNIQNINLIKNNLNSGVYFNLNYCLGYHKDDDYGFWTCQGSDDISKTNRIFDMVKNIKNNTAIGHTYDREKQNIGNIIGVGLIMYKKKVFKVLGYYDNTRFGGDSEYYERHLNFIGKVPCINNKSYWADYSKDCLTSIHKLNERVSYEKRFRVEHKNGTIYRDTYQNISS